MPEVLCLPNGRIEALNVPQGLSRFNEALYYDLTNPKFVNWIEKAAAEDDAEYRQIIPYAIIRLGDQIFAYTRSKAGGEARLADKASLGFGGHVERQDVKWPASPMVTWLENCLRRELREEIGLDVAKCRTTVVAFIRDDSNKVGQVHLGVVFEIHAAEQSWILNAPRDPEINDVYSIPLVDLKNDEYKYLRDNLEPWSALILRDYLGVT